MVGQAIRGDEFAGKIPSTPEVLRAVIKARKTGPLVNCSPDEVGNMLPSVESPGLAAQIKEDLEKSMGKGADEKIDDALVESRMTVRLLRGSYLSANDIGGSCALVTGRAVQEIALGGTPPRLQTWQHPVWETKTAKGEVFQEKTDELPDCLIPPADRRYCFLETDGRGCFFGKFSSYW